MELLRFAGSRVKRPKRSSVSDFISSLAAGSYEVVDATWEHTNVLEVARPGRWSSVWPMWFSDSWEFAGWYVNFQEPLRRSRLGWDTFDLSLDIVVSPARTWHWKDEDHFEMMQAAGIISAEVADEVRREADTVICDIDNVRYPFDRDWSAWRPPPDWEDAAIADDWHKL